MPEIAGRRPFYLKAEQKRTGHRFFSTSLLLCEERSHVTVKNVNTFLKNILCKIDNTCNVRQEKIPGPTKIFSCDSFGRSMSLISL